MQILYLATIAFLCILFDDLAYDTIKTATIAHLLILKVLKEVGLRIVIPKSWCFILCQLPHAIADRCGTCAIPPNSLPRSLQPLP